MRAIFVALTLALFAMSGCKGGNGQSSKATSQTASQGAPQQEPGTPKTYCEKSFACKLALVKGQEARQVLLSRREVAIKHCEELMSKMPEQLRREYEACVNVKCGDELAKCVEGAAERAAKALGLPVKKEDRPKSKGAASPGKPEKRLPKAGTRDGTSSNDATGMAPPTADIPPPPPEIMNKEITKAELSALGKKGANWAPPRPTDVMGASGKKVKVEEVQPPVGVMVSEPALQVVGGR